MFPGVNMLNSLFWMVFGVMQILVIAGLHTYAKEKNKNIKWWQTTIIYSIFAAFLLTIGGGFTLAGEYESQAGWYFIGILGVPCILALAIAVRLFVVKKQA